MDKILDIASKVSTPLGLAGITLGILLLIFREIIRKEIFPTLTKNLSAEIIKLLIRRLFVLALVSMLLGFAGFALTAFLGQNPSNESDQTRMIQYAGQVIDSNGNPVFGAIVQIRDEHGDIQEARTDSTGRYQYALRSSSGSTHYKVISDSHESYERDLSPDRTAGEPFILKTKSGTIQANTSGRVNLDRNLTGIELSFTPLPELWDRVALACGRIKSPEQDVSFIDAAMTAERAGDHWDIDFAPVKVLGGTKKFRKLSTAEANNKAFDDVIDAALLGLRIEWGNGTNATLEPWDRKYPSVIHISHDRIALTLRSPLISWTLNELENKPTIKFYGRDYPVGLPPTVRIRSLDPAVAFDQTIRLEWKQRERKADYDFQMYRKASGPHTLKYVFSASPNPQRQ